MAVCRLILQIRRAEAVSNVKELTLTDNLISVALLHIKGLLSQSLNSADKFTYNTFIIVQQIIAKHNSGLVQT